jgi:hypothetical protein
MAIVNVTLVAVALFAVAGCKSSATEKTGSPDAATGAGGQTGIDSAADQASDHNTSSVEAGAGGSGARDGAQDAEAGSGAGGCLGVCLETFLAQCSEIGQSCTTATTSGGQTNTCYANGVKQAKVAQASGTTIVIVQTSAGQTCYESDLTGTAETITTLGGKTVAQITHTSSTQLTVDCYAADGSVVTTNVDLTTPACAATHAAMIQTCTAGTCTF